MSILEWLVTGVLCGLLTHRVTPLEGPSVDIALGISGALLGGFVFVHAVAPARADGVDLASLAAAVCGAAVFLVLERILVRSRLH